MVKKFIYSEDWERNFNPKLISLRDQLFQVHEYYLFSEAVEKAIVITWVL